MDRNVGDFTALLKRYSDGDREALTRLMPLVYEELRHIARIHMSKQSASHTLSPTALVHELYLRVQKNKEIAFHDRRHFFLAASRCMKWILVDYARAKNSKKRGGASIAVLFDEQVHAVEKTGVDVSNLSEALEKLASQDERACEVLELHFLVGLTIEEVAETLEMSLATAKRDLSVAKMWVRRYLDTFGQELR